VYPNLLDHMFMQAIGFVRTSDKPEDQLVVKLGRTGLIYFYDCCGADCEDAPGCRVGRHMTYDELDE
jgi:hypothetical protein